MNNRLQIKVFELVPNQAPPVLGSLKNSWFFKVGNKKGHFLVLSIMNLNLKDTMRAMLLLGWRDVV